MRTHDYTPWQTYCAALGFNTAEMRLIREYHAEIQHSGSTWPAIKAEFFTLTPPIVTGNDRDDNRHRPSGQSGARLRAAIYTAQDGRCAYCGQGLLPLDWRKLIPPIPRGVAAQRLVPELDHRTPLSRGGTHARENLSFACRHCNQAKAMRTAEEFAEMPNDAFSRIKLLPPLLTAWILEYEQRGYEKFHLDGYAPRPDASWLAGRKAKDAYKQRRTATIG